VVGLVGVARMGVAGAVLGAVPLFILAWVIVATVMGWAEWR
jgi:hypothetical protein